MRFLSDGKFFEIGAPNWQDVYKRQGRGRTPAQGGPGGPFLAVMAQAQAPKAIEAEKRPRRWRWPWERKA